MAWEKWLEGRIAWPYLFVSYCRGGWEGVGRAGEFFFFLLIRKVPYLFYFFF